MRKIKQIIITESTVRPLGRPGVNGSVILKLIGNRVGQVCGLDSSGSEQGLVEGSLKHGNEPSGSIKDEEFLD
jgi:hypothetical protein